jgi:hypothetical protein
MKRVHYFQRFSKKEDVVTNNTLLLFARLQHQNSRFFQQILRELISDDEIVVGALLTQQETATSGTIPDGVIRQRSFHIVLETKLHANFNVEQLQGHLAKFELSKEGLEVLLLLGTREPDDVRGARRVVADFNAQHTKSVRLAWTTFAKVIETCRDVLPEHERIMAEILDDYEDFCNEEGLIPTSDDDFLVVGCSQSLPENLEFRLYYNSAKPHRPPKYIGFYDAKAVQAICDLEKMVYVDRVENRLQIIGDGALTQEEETRIIGSMDRASKRGWDITSGHCFFLAGRVEQTLFCKQTKYPLWSRRYFDLHKVLGLDPKKKLPDLPSLALELHNKQW